jgi:hypothetical protein
MHLQLLASQSKLHHSQYELGSSFNFDIFYLIEKMIDYEHHYDLHLDQTSQLPVLCHWSEK